MSEGRLLKADGAVIIEAFEKAGFATSGLPRKKAWQVGERQITRIEVFSSPERDPNGDLSAIQHLASIHWRPKQGWVLYVAQPVLRRAEDLEFVVPHVDHMLGLNKLAQEAWEKTRRSKSSTARYQSILASIFTRCLDQGTSS